MSNINDSSENNINNNNNSDAMTSSAPQLNQIPPPLSLFQKAPTNSLIHSSKRDGKYPTASHPKSNDNQHINSRVEDKDAIESSDGDTAVEVSVGLLEGFRGAVLEGCEVLLEAPLCGLRRKGGVRGQCGL